MASLFNTRISDTYVSLIKSLDNSAISATLKQLSDGSGNSLGIYVNTSGDFKVNGILEWGSLKDTGEDITITKFVDEADGIANNDNDTTIPTSAAIIDYVASRITLEDLDFSGDSGSGSVDLDSQTFAIVGTTNEIETSASNQQLQIGIVTNPTLTGNVTITGDLNISQGEIINIGTDFDLYETATGAYIQYGSNPVIFNGNADVIFRKQGSEEKTAVFTPQGSAKLYYDNSLKLETTTNGLTVTGITDTDGITSSAEIDVDLASEGTYFEGGSGNIRRLSITSGTNISAHALHTFNINSSNGKYKFDIGGTEEFSIALGNASLAGNLTIAGDLTVNGTTTTFYGDITLDSDTKRLKLGDSQDLQLYHDGNNSYISEQGTGELKLLASSVAIQSATGNEYIAYFAGTGGQTASLYAGNSKKFETTSTGVSVTGSATISSDLILSDYGSGTHTGTATQRLGVDSSGNVIEIPIGAGAVDGAGATGQASFWTDSDTISGDDDFYWDNTNKRLGVGTNSPAYELVVNDETGSSVIQLRTGTTTSENNILFGDSDSNAQGRVQYNHTGDYLALWTAGSERARLDSSGNLGLGTSSPASGLQVAKGSSTIPTAGASTSSACFGNDSSDDNYGVVLGANSSGVGYISSQRTDGIATTYNLAIQPNGGNVGISTSSPNARLSLGNGTGQQFYVYEDSDVRAGLGVNLSGSSRELSMFCSSSNGYSDGNISFGYRLESNGAYQERMRLTSAGLLGINESSPSELLHINNGNLRLDASTNGVDGLFRLYDASNVESGQIYPHSGDLRIYSPNDIIFNNAGSVGIGTTSPSTKLHIEGATVGYLQTIKNTTAGGEYLQMLAETGDPVFEFQSGGTGGEATLNMYRDGTQYVLISADAGVDNYFNNGSNVGIGTDSPASKLQVNVGTNQNVAINSNGGVATIDAYDDAVFNSVPLIINGSDLRFRNNSSEAVRITGGNVGIGNSSPTVAVDVKGTTNLSSRFIFTKDLSTDKVLFGGADHDSFDTFIGSSSNHSFTITQNGASAITINTSKNVGIGTTSPNNKLTVSADGGGSAISYFNNTNSSGYGILINTPDTNNARYALRVNTGVGTVFNVGNGGNVGIGTTSPSTELHVKASSGFAEARLAGASGSGSSLEFYEDTTALADIYANTSKDLIFRTNGTSERARITSGGALCVNTTDDTPNGVSTSASIVGYNDGSVFAGHFATHTSASSDVLVFSNTNGQVGSVSTSGSATAYNTSSDYRLKEDLKDFNALEIASKIKMYDFKWKADDSRTYGVMAHELQEVLPQAVTGEKDAENMQQVDYSKLVPILLKGMQEQQAMIDELKAEIDELKNNV